MGAPAKTDRNAEVVEAYRRDPDVTLSQLADRFGVTRQRIYQLLNNAGVFDRTRRPRRRYPQNIHLAVCTTWMATPVVTKVARLHGLAPDTARQLLEVNGFEVYQRPRPRPAHGTPAGFRAHAKEGTDPCPACRVANSEHSQAVGRYAGSERAACPVCARKIGRYPAGGLYPHINTDGEWCRP